MFVKLYLTKILKATKEILKLKHCFAHTLSITVKAAIHGDPQFSAAIEKYRNTVTFFRSSSHATAKLNIFCCGTAKTKLQPDVRFHKIIIQLFVLRVKFVSQNFVT